MPYAERNESGEIISLQQFPKTEDDEYLEPSHPDIVRFTKTSKRRFYSESDTIDLIKALTQPDRETARISEDIIALLIEQKSLVVPELPEAIQNKLLERRRLRHLIAFGANGYIFEGCAAM